jgi:hypothetical protein
MLTVACVLKSGGIYDATWVERLRAGVKRYLPIEHLFVCLSDVDVPCERIALDHGWPGWWSKVEVFNLPGPILFFDLDTAIVGDLTDIANTVKRADKLIALRDFYRGGNGLGSGVLGWSAADRFQIRLFDQFAVAPEFWMRHCSGGGDQEYLERAIVVDERRPLRWQDVVPGQIVSYKVHCQGGIPAGARVVCLHGRPKFGDMAANDPVRLAWEAAA